MKLRTIFFLFILGLTISGTTIFLPRDSSQYSVEGSGNLPIVEKMKITDDKSNVLLCSDLDTVSSK